MEGLGMMMKQALISAEIYPVAKLSHCSGPAEGAQPR